MFPKYSDIVSLVFRQVLANHLMEEMSNATKIKIHAEVTGALNILIGEELGHIRTEHNSFTSYAEVDINVEEGFTAWVQFDWYSQTFTQGYVA